jgi:RNA polymerase sigma factor (sigma-70 family)
VSESFGDTRAGGPDRQFPATPWTAVLNARGRDPDVVRKNLGHLIARYWKPVYHSIRAGWGKSNEEAKDLTQGFFLELLEKDFLKAVSPDRGRFRTFLRHALKCHLVDDRERQAALKRGGGVLHVPIDATGGAPAPDASPDGVFDREWAHCLLDQAVELTRSFLAEAGKEPYFLAFRMCHLDAEPKSYREAAEELGIAATDVHNHLTYAREILRKALRDLIRRTVNDESEVDDELAQMQRVLSEAGRTSWNAQAPRG